MFVFLVGFVAAPFAVTGWYRVGFMIDPFILQMAAPFVLLAVVVAYICVRTPLRSLAVGLGAGAVAWALFLMWLFAAWSSVPHMP